jgi:hypothetical protein
MPRPGKTYGLHVCDPATPTRHRDADIYHRYAVGLYRQALLGALPDILRRLTTSLAAAVDGKAGGK